jgi:hypothetical protein
VNSDELQVTIWRDTHDKLRRAQDLFRHANLPAIWRRSSTGP